MATAANPFNVQSGIIGGSMTNATDTTAAQYTAQERAVQAGTETTAGQLESILAKDSPLMQRARTQATQDMAKRGLINSSMSAGAGVAAMIDRATPIAERDAQTYSDRAIANMGAVNQAGLTNVGEQNKYGLQLGDQKFTAAENLAGRSFQTSERIGGQVFTSEQNKATQDFQAAQSQLDRALQTNLSEKTIESQQALQAAQQVFQGAQNELDRVNQKTLQESQQLFTSKENQLDRAQQTELQTAAQAFQATEAEKSRAQEIMLADKNISANQALEQSRQEFQAEQAGLDRTQATTLAKENQTFQASQNELSRAQEIMLADKSITAQKALETARQEFQRGESALDRTQQTAIADKQIQANKELQTAQQTFTSAQNDLDRAQQVALTDKSIKAQQDLATATQNFQSAQNELDRTQQTNIANANIKANQDLATAQQTFTAAQGKLDRDQQTAITNLQNDLSQANVSKSFAANLALSTSTAINTIAGDANLSNDPKDKDPATGLTPKQAAIQNAIDNANYTMQWGATFYNATLPKIGTPGSTTSPGVVNPGEGAGGGTNRTPATAAEITEIYRSVLGREPDAEGLRNWVGSGQSLEEIRNQIGRSDEAISRGGGGGATGGPQFPANIASYTGPQKGQVYKDLVAKGYSDTDIRSAWEAKTGGAASNTDWDSLKAEAAKL